MIRWREVGSDNDVHPEKSRSSLLHPGAFVPIAPPQCNCRSRDAAVVRARTIALGARGRGRDRAGAPTPGSMGIVAIRSAWRHAAALAFGRRNAERTNLAGRPLRRARRLGADGAQDRRQRAGSGARRGARLAVREQAIHLRAVGGRTESGDARHARRGRQAAVQSAGAALARPGDNRRPAQRADRALDPEGRGGRRAPCPARPPGTPVEPARPIRSDRHDAAVQPAGTSEHPPQPDAASPRHRGAAAGGGRAVGGAIRASAASPRGGPDRRQHRAAQLRRRERRAAGEAGLLARRRRAADRC